MPVFLFRHMSLFRSVFISVWLISSASLALADDNVIDKIKSVYIYNFLSFIQWPEPKVPMTEYQLCMIADQEIIQKLKSVVVGELMNGLPIIVTLLSDNNLITGCHLLYIQGNREVSSVLLREAFQSGTLLIGDAKSLNSKGLGMVGFETRGRKVRVAVNLTRLKEAGFKVSSKLLRVVRIVR
ncbi:YfiR family protein [Neptunomonas japonica]|uniref:YfiR family protein n=1 Tax=Neptunomonas japonica TaxID=417574 RepID=UPI00048F49D4|nr:YfiR family protein [Neptunomonas japonica]